jgi:putative oxygen-independent coproporphyrinogen III oxidase
VSTPSPDPPLGLYVHVPFCASRCGYCDFNTYVPGTITGPGADPVGYVEAAAREIRLAREVMGERAGALDTVFFGGGTPTLLPPSALARLIEEIRAEFGLRPGAEVTTEANPESVDPASLAALRAAGFTRVSLGMQSAARHVLDVLDRRHRPGRAVAAAREARAAGFEEVSLDLIYGTPGETAADWEASLEAALSAGPTHLSAYALVVEPGTALARRVARGELPRPDDDVLADRYERADAVLSAAGLAWYEISNWGSPCRHNIGYWTGGDWWGIGPGAHSHLAGVRWWNRKHPAAYAAALAAGHSPEQGREVLTAGQRADERVLLGLRLAEGLPAAGLDPAALRKIVVDDLARLLPSASGPRVVLSLRGRLLADAVVRELVA